MSSRPPARELLVRDGALLALEDLRALGLDERTIHRVLRGLPEVAPPGVRRIYYAAEDLRRALRR